MAGIIKNCCFILNFIIVVSLYCCQASPTSTATTLTESTSTDCEHAYGDHWDRNACDKCGYRDFNGLYCGFGWRVMRFGESENFIVALFKCIWDVTFGWIIF